MDDTLFKVVTGLTSILCFMYFGSLAWRLRGDGTSEIPQRVRRSFNLYMSLVVSLTLKSNIFLAALCAAISYSGIIAGHGRYYTLGRGTYPPRPDNFYGVAVSKMLPRVRRYSHTFDAAALALTGMHLMLGVSCLFFYYGHWEAGIMFLLIGALKATVYEIGWRLYSKTSDPMAQIEELYGAFLGFSLGLFLCAIRFYRP